MIKLINAAYLFLAICLGISIMNYPSYTKWYEEFELENGLQVIVIPNHKIPAVSQMIWYHVGAKDEAQGKSGLAHFLEHLMFKGTPKYPDGQFSKLIAENAGEENAMTSHDYTAYFQKIEKSKLPLIMELEADRMQNLQLAKEQVVSENKVIVEERHMRYDNSPRMLLIEKMDAALFGSNHYAIQAIGLEKEMRGLTREDALAFYKKYYAPDNATLIIAGDVDVAEVKNLALKYYGNIPRGGKIERSSLAVPVVTSSNVEIIDARVKQPELWKKYLAPSYVYGNPQIATASTILSRILGEGTSARLYQSLVVEQKLAVAAGANYDALSFGPADFSFYALPANGVSIEKLKLAMDAEVAKIVKDGITDEELSAAKRAIIAEMTYGREGLQGLSLVAGQVVSVGLAPEFVNNLPANISAVPKAQVKEAAKYILAEKNSVTGVLRGR